MSGPNEKILATDDWIGCCIRPNSQWSASHTLRAAYDLRLFDLPINLWIYSVTNVCKSHILTVKQPVEAFFFTRCNQFDLVRINYHAARPESTAMCDVWSDFIWYASCAIRFITKFGSILLLFAAMVGTVVVVAETWNHFTFQSIHEWCRAWVYVCFIPILFFQGLRTRLIRISSTRPRASTRTAHQTIQTHTKRIIIKHKQ